MEEEEGGRRKAFEGDSEVREKRSWFCWVERDLFCSRRHICSESRNAGGLIVEIRRCNVRWRMNFEDVIA